MKKRIYLTLSDGSIWPGNGDIEAPVEGEVVFTTASCGYPQTLTDPSYNGQIIVFAFPPIGIYGVDKENLEGRRVWARAALMTCLDETEEGRFESLSCWMAENGRPLVSDIDTRQLILKIRECGSMMGRIDVEPHLPEIKELPHTLVAEVSCSEREICGEGELTVALMDYGVKENIVRGMVRRGCRVIRFPHNTAAAEVLASGADGILLSNGPGDPAVLDFEAGEIAKMLGAKPILGVCLGNQLLARACGAKTKKLPFGHAARISLWSNAPRDAACSRARTTSTPWTGIRSRGPTWRSPTATLGTARWRGCATDVSTRSPCSSTRRPLRDRRMPPIFSIIS